tara:strand:- start:10707 stop:11291 length:585 start_codon:yes stop_codon:yes gene_type:complete
MKKVTYIVAVALTSTILFSCAEKAQKEEKIEKEVIIEKEISEEDVMAKEINVDSIASSIDEYRVNIEENIGDGEEISTAEMRAKVKQKWSKIHFYMMDGNIVRIKTYPHAEVSTRTEEFYLKDGNLVLAVIEDNGEGERGKAKESIDKMYYYLDGGMIKEVNGEEKAEYAIKQSDAEELLSEVKEYLEAYKAKM